MSKLLDIFITHWTEPWDIIRPGMMMLSVQRRVDWENVGVTIIHDGTAAFPNELMSGFPFTVNQVCLPHGGVSASRNYAIDNSDATWIKFCDCDDMFAGVYSLSCVMDILPNSKQYDMLWFPFIFDPYYGNQMVLEGSPVFIHDKVLRRSFLNKTHIRFNENLTFSEDFAFVSLIKMTLDNIRVGKIDSNFPIYVYNQRPGGVANRDDFWLKNKVGLFDAHCYVEEELMKHGFTHDSDTMVARAICESYVAVSTANKAIDTTDFVGRVFEYYERNKDRLQNLNDQDWEYIIEITNEQNHSQITREMVEMWIDMNTKGTEDERIDQ